MNSAGYYFTRMCLGSETLYYKEHIYLKVWYEINVEMHFKNGILVSMEQGDEKRMDVDDRDNR